MMYVVHIKNLNQALTHGMKLKNVHWAIRFEESHWMKPYIMLNTTLTTAAKNEFDKDLFRLTNKKDCGKYQER